MPKTLRQKPPAENTALGSLKTRDSSIDPQSRSFKGIVGPSNVCACQTVRLRLPIQPRSERQVFSGLLCSLFSRSTFVAMLE